MSFYSRIFNYGVHRMFAHGTRFHVDPSHRQLLDEELFRGNERIVTWMKSSDAHPALEFASATIEDYQNDLHFSFSIHDDCRNFDPEEVNRMSFKIVNHRVVSYDPRVPEPLPTAPTKLPPTPQRTTVFRSDQQAASPAPPAPSAPSAPQPLAPSSLVAFLAPPSGTEVPVNTSHSGAGDTLPAVTVTTVDKQQSSSPPAPDGIIVDKQQSPSPPDGVPAGGVPNLALNLDFIADAPIPSPPDSQQEQREQERRLKREQLRRGGQQ
jgi:hypothetical protein